VQLRVPEKPVNESFVKWTISAKLGFCKNILSAAARNAAFDTKTGTRKNKISTKLKIQRTL
jgi:hypothetical protein